MKAFVQRFADKILGVISGFDRVRFRGSLRLLASVGGTGAWLHSKGILLKDFLSFAEGLTKQLREQSKQIAEEAGRPVTYLEGFCNKEELVRQIRDEQGVADNGLVAVLSTLETCRSYDIYRNRETQQIDLRRRPRKALHHYFYFEDGKFGLTQVRLMTWFPFDVHVVLNGREWLARDLDKANIGYLRRDNCFAHISDFEQAQKLAAKHPKIGWPAQLERLLRRVHPLHQQFFTSVDSYGPLSYYWTSDQTEWATDIAFRDSAELADLYPALLHRGMEVFQSPDVMRFLGHKLAAKTTRWIKHMLLRLMFCRSPKTRLAADTKLYTMTVLALTTFTLSPIRKSKPWTASDNQVNSACWKNGSVSKLARRSKRASRQSGSPAPSLFRARLRCSLPPRIVESKSCGVLLVLIRRGLSACHLEHGESGNKDNR